MTKDKFIFIKRRPYTKDERYGKAPELVAQDKWSIGSSITKSGAVYKGLSPTEERILMPHIIGMPSADVNFLRASNEWFSDMKKVVPITDLKLNISLEDDNRKLSEDNLPIVIEDYVLYRFCLGHSYVVDSRQALYGSNTALFYIYNPEEQAAVESKSAVSVINSIKALTEIYNDELVLDAVLKVLTGKYDGQRNPIVRITNPEELSLPNKQALLTNIATTYPEDFIEVAKSDDLKPRAEVYELISRNVIENTGSTFVFMSRELGKTIDHVVAFIQSPVNNELYVHMKGKLEAITKRPYPKKKKPKEEVLLENKEV